MHILLKCLLLLYLMVEVVNSIVIFVFVVVDFVVVVDFDSKNFVFVVLDKIFLVLQVVDEGLALFKPRRNGWVLLVVTA